MSELMPANDAYLYLEDIHGDEPLAWVDRHNRRTEQRWATPAFEALKQRMLAALDAPDRIPFASLRGGYAYNYWRDADNPLGIWRRTPEASYFEAEPVWETLLDVDQLSRDEGVTWVFQGAHALRPDFRRVLLTLSPEGGDANRVREYDLTTRAFTGLDLPVSKGRAAWARGDDILAGRDFGEGTLTSSGYPRQSRLFRASDGAYPAQGSLVFEVPAELLLAGAGYDATEGHERYVFTAAIDFYTSRTWVLECDADPTATHAVTLDGNTYTVPRDAKLIDVPLDVEVTFHREWALLRPQIEWSVAGNTYVAGGLYAARVDALVAGERALTTLFAPTETTALESLTATRNYLVLTILDNVTSRVSVLDPANDFAAHDLPGAPALATTSVGAVDSHERDDLWLTVSGFLSPTTLLFGSAVPGAETAREVRSAPAQFDASGLEVTQHFTASLDGTRVPYFQIGRPGAQHQPTLLYGYGGFEISLTPAYAPVQGLGWLERGGVLVIANIRGGGEYGPGWHRAALRENRHRAYEDFAAVGRDLIARGVTTPAQLGCRGGSNGGLLVGNMLTQYPDLFGAVCCLVPLLDMERYTVLSAGASWVAEYGDPAVPADWEFIQTFSPLHLLREGIEYPPVLFYTATSDDRVGPVQARKMAAKMVDLASAQNQAANVWFYENREGGHAGASNNEQSAHEHALCYEFLWRSLAGAA
ncbi:S9 family peptidase [Micrococcales bacterium 31B]|nr:S9 family peptidase [Micrococcales bacterium 31B]